MKKVIEIQEHNPCWVDIFEQEAEVLREILQDEVIDIHHVGSTSIPGCFAKPKIDIILVAKNKAHVTKLLELYNWINKGEYAIPFEIVFAKRGAHNINLHTFFDPDHPEIELNLTFRDYLRSHVDLVKEYSKLKQEILANPENLEVANFGSFALPVYTLKKRKFIDKVLEMAGFNRLRMLRCTLEEDWQMAEKFAQRPIKDQPGDHVLIYRGIHPIGYADIENQTEKGVS
jgi:GrpB-like predicted nucleotidyltransferase (UPF0157 family)